MNRNFVLSEEEKRRRAARFKKEGSSYDKVDRFSSLIIGGDDGLTRTPAEQKDESSVRAALEKLKEHMKTLNGSSVEQTNSDAWEEVLRGFRRLTMTATAGGVDRGLQIEVYESAADAALDAGDLKFFLKNLGRLPGDLQDDSAERLGEFRLNCVLFHGLFSGGKRELILGMKQLHDERHLKFALDCLRAARWKDLARYFSLQSSAPFRTSRQILALAIPPLREQAMQVYFKGYLSLDSSYMTTTLGCDKAQLFQLLKALRPDLIPFNSEFAEQYQFRKIKAKPLKSN